MLEASILADVVSVSLSALRTLICGHASQILRGSTVLTVSSVEHAARLGRINTALSHFSLLHESIGLFLYLGDRTLFDFPVMGFQGDLPPRDEGDDGCGDKAISIEAHQPTFPFRAASTRA